MTDRERFPRSLLWWTGPCADWHSREQSVPCRDCDAIEQAQRRAAQDPLAYAVLLRLEGIPFRPSVRVTQ